jgi:hypothetical protein
LCKPVKEAFASSNAFAIGVLNVIGFDFKEGFNGQLHEIAKAGGGKYYEAHSQKVRMSPRRPSTGKRIYCQVCANR